MRCKIQWPCRQKACCRHSDGADENRVVRSPCSPCRRRLTPQSQKRTLTYIDKWFAWVETANLLIILVCLFLVITSWQNPAVGYLRSVEDIRGQQTGQQNPNRNCTCKWWLEACVTRHALSTRYLRKGAPEARTGCCKGGACTLMPWMQNKGPAFSPHLWTMSSDV